MALHCSDRAVRNGSLRGEVSDSMLSQRLVPSPSSLRRGLGRDDADNTIEQQQLFCGG